MTNPIKIQNEIHASLENAWNAYTQPQHIVNWNFASDDWHCPQAEVELKPGGTYKARMEAKDGSFGFDFIATFDYIEPQNKIQYHLDDGRKVETIWETKEDSVIITTYFEPENQNPIEMQQEGWQAILNNYKKYVEGLR
jgi:uncharacterized protein YndB with AHSA1/START domain